MYYTIYKTTNLINSKIYIGCHKTNNLEDDYLGSGIALKGSIKRHGIKNFKKETLCIFDNPEDMFNMEARVVNGGFIKENSNYNLKIGGSGGHCHANPKTFSERCKQAALKSYANGRVNGMKDKTHSSKTRKIMSNIAKINQKGDGNSQYGTMWIYNDLIKKSKKIGNTASIPDGWLKGRRIKF